MEFYFGGEGAAGGCSGRRKKETAEGIKRGDTFASFDTLLATLAHTHSRRIHALSHSHLEASCLKNLCPVSISLNWDSRSRRERVREGEDSKEESERERNVFLREWKLRERERGLLHAYNELSSTLTLSLSHVLAI